MLRFELNRYDSEGVLTPILVALVPENQWPPEEVLNWLNSSASGNEKYEWIQVINNDPHDPLKDIK